MNKVDQAKTIEDIFRTVNNMTQDLIELQNQVVQLKVFQGNENLTPEKSTAAIPTKCIKEPSRSVIDKFTAFTTELITVKIEGDSIEISYVNSGQMTTFNREEIYDIFINLPDKFDRLTVKDCIKNLGIEPKNETLLMRFFVHQFKNHCERTTKGSKDRLIIRKL